MTVNRKGNKNPFAGKKHSEETKKKMSDQRKGKKQSEETKAKRSAALKGRTRSPEIGTAISLKLTGVPKSEEHKRNMSLSMMGHKWGTHTAESKQKISQSKIGIPRPEFSDEWRENMGVARRGKKLPPRSLEFIQKQIDSHVGKGMGKDNPNWKNGISFEPYCDKFTPEFRERVRNFFGRVCVNEDCRKTEANNKRRLSVHHVNYDKMVCCNDVKPLFAAVCNSCNSKANHNREHWQSYYTDIINEKHGGKSYIPKVEKKRSNRT